MATVKEIVAVFFLYQLKNRIIKIMFGKLVHIHL